ncbi:DUF4349 domain-containing protein [Candidatus Roizmanbacteria bacterium]|nr:DUF4349 domain-containing protein [Candidatus Roizmanbacteria bacterium]
MGKIIGWIKNNKLTFVLLLIVGYFIFKSFLVTNLSRIPSYNGNGYGGYGYSPEIGAKPSNLQDGTFSGVRSLGKIISPPQEAAPTTDVTNRMVISESYLSLLVKSVVESQKQIIQTAETLGGYMVNSNLNNPQDAPTATVVVRVPANKLQAALEAYRGLAVKVISENLSGQDVTDEYVDNQARLDTLEKTKAKFEEIFDKATQIQDILQIQREIINLQAEIDSVKGQQNYLEKNAQMAKLTIYLSTDELALPYSPSETWRPAVIFKQATRSLLGNLRKLGTALIWLSVYSIIWIPALLLIYYLKKKKTT